MMKLTPGEAEALQYAHDRMLAVFSSGDTGRLSDSPTVAEEDANEQFCRDGESLLRKLRAEYGLTL